MLFPQIQTLKITSNGSLYIKFLSKVNNLICFLVTLMKEGMWTLHTDNEQECLLYLTL